MQSFEKVNCIIAKWQGYSKTKQFALEQTKHNWVLWIDADEKITDELKDELQNITETKPKYVAYSIPRKAYFLGKWIKHSGWYPGRVTRLFNKTKVHFSDSEVHEHLVIKGEVGKLKSDLEHFTDPTINHYFKKFNKYTTLAASELFSKNTKFKLSDLLIRPPFIFIKMYFLRKGFLDGLHGLILACFSTLYVFAKYSKLWELENRNK